MIKQRFLKIHFGEPETRPPNSCVAAVVLAEGGRQRRLRQRRILLVSLCHLLGGGGSNWRKFDVCGDKRLLTD